MSNHSFNIEFNYEVYFTTGVFDTKNHTLVDLIRNAENQTPIKAAFLIDENVNQKHPGLVDEINTYCQIHQLRIAGQPLILPGGEFVKNDIDFVFKSLRYIDEAKIDRHSYLIAIGGGALLDMAGFVAAIGHRGVRHIRIPTTVLSQNDSGVGVKNGVNFGGKKNFIGTFSPPFGVICDRNFLLTLDDRDWRGGISEAIKVALLKDSTFYEWIEQNVTALNDRNLDSMIELVERCATLHMDHIRTNGDPFEKGSSRPLDFGHWAAHKLEQLTDFQIRHGEAVAIGLAIDNLYAWKKGLLSEGDCHRILKCLSSLGFELFHPKLINDTGDGVNPKLIAGLDEFREHLGGELTIMLLEKIGRAVEVHQMDPQLIESSVLFLKEHFNSIHADLQ